MNAHNAGVEAQNGTVGSGSYHRMPVVTDLHHCDEAQDPDPHQVTDWIRIRTSVMRIRNTAY
jgi:hypothetical protein